MEILFKLKAEISKQIEKKGLSFGNYMSTWEFALKLKKRACNFEWQTIKALLPTKHERSKNDKYEANKKKERRRTARRASE